MGLHTAVYRATGGRIGHRIPGLPAMLLLYLDDGDDVVIVASKGGYPRHPGWFHNLQANPQTTIQIGSERRAVRARVATAEERRRLWPRAVDAYSGYADYQRKADREIPMVVLERR